MKAAVATTAHEKRPISRQAEYLLRGVADTPSPRLLRSAVSSSAARSSECMEESLRLVVKRGSAGAITAVGTICGDWQS